MSGVLLKGLSAMEDMVDGTFIHQLLLWCPLSCISGLYRRGGDMITAVLCFKWIRMVVAMLPNRGMIGFLCRGALVPLLIIEYMAFNYFTEKLVPHSSYSTSDLLNSAIGSMIAGLFVIFLKSEMVWTGSKFIKMQERAKAYKEKIGLDCKICARCEVYTVFRSRHSAITGARNLLPMVVFNFMYMTYHYYLLAICVELYPKKEFEQIEPSEIFFGSIIVVYGIMHSFKEFIICCVSLLTGTTVVERSGKFAAPYFKGGHGLAVNPFDKGMLVHLLEAFYASVGFDPARNYEGFDPHTLFADDDEEGKKADTEVVFSKFLNPYATKLACNWMKMDILTVFEVDSPVRDNMIVVMRKIVAKKLKNPNLKSFDYSDDEEDDYDQDYDVSDYRPGHQGQQHSHNGCGCHHGESNQKVMSQPLTSDMPTMPTEGSKNDSTVDSIHTDDQMI